MQATKQKLETLSREIMRQNFRAALRGHHLPGVPARGQVAVFAADPRFYDFFQKTFRGSSRFHRLTPTTLAYVAAEIARSDNIFSVYYASGSQSARWLAGLRADLRAKLIVINCNNAGKIPAQADFFAVLNINSRSPESGGWLAEAWPSRSPGVSPLPVNAPVAAAWGAASDRAPASEGPRKTKVRRPKKS